MIRLLAATLALTATVALAHEGVKDPDVKARMQLMTEIGASTKILGEMAKRTRAFDAAEANAAAARLATLATQIPAAFQTRADDPKSEARPVIWQDFDGFTADAQAMQTAASAASGSIEELADLRMALAGIGKSCGACHEDYRE